MIDGGDMSRRKFVKVSTGVVAGSLLTGPLLRPFGGAVIAAVPRRDRLKVGLIGCGGRGTGAALQALKADPGTVLWSMGDAFAERIDSSLNHITNENAKEAAKAGSSGSGDDTYVPSKKAPQVEVAPERRLVGFDAYQRIIDECDVVLLCEPPHFRPRHLRAAVDAGKHVFCEKPVAVDGPGVRSVLESAAIAQSKNLALVSGFCWRYSARECETMAQVHEGAIGDIRAIYTTYNAASWVDPKPRQQGWSDMEFQLRNWHHFTWLSGDHIVEQACHSIDKIAWAMNGRLPVQCTAVGGRQSRPEVPETGHVYDHFAATFDYADGARAFHMCRHFPGSPFDNSDYVMGADGICRINGWAKLHEITGRTNWKSEHPGNNMYQQEHDDLFASIRSGRPINDGVWMAHSTLMSIMARMAAYTAQTVTWEQALESSERLGPEAYEWGSLPTPKVARPGVRA